MKLGALAPLLSTPQRRAVLIALSSAYMLVQLSSLPVALSLPTLAEHFNRGVDDAAWMVVLYLLTLGAFVMLGARLGDRYGHARVFFIGLVLSTIGSILIALSTSLLQVIIWRGLTGLGSALIMGNANAILAAAFPQEERGRAFSVPIVGARFGTLVGLALFALFLQYLSWRLVFLTFVPMGILAIAVSRPMLMMLKDEPRVNLNPVDIPGGLMLVATSVVFLLAGAHLHGGEESYTSDQGILYHGGMYVLAIALLGVFILIERRMKNPLVDIQHFRHKYFSLSLVSNVTFHFSMLATMTLVPIIVELGYNKSPIWVPLVLLPNQIIGLFMTFAAGWIYDKYQPKLLRPAAMVSIAAGFLLLGIFIGGVTVGGASIGGLYIPALDIGGGVPIWYIPLLMIPISFGTAFFNPVNNAMIMSSLPMSERGFASGMLETTRELGHALGSTVSATALAMVLPVGIALLSPEQVGPFYLEGFQTAAMLVVMTMLTGGIIAFFHKPYSETQRPSTPAAAAAGND
ncbi:MAG: MFS transporter [Chloroflexota bacterium]|nr:MFS transporter [Chloroflexota bacterium]